LPRGAARTNGHAHHEVQMTPLSRIRHSGPHSSAPQALAPSHPWLVGPAQGRRLRVGAEDCTIKVQDAHSGAAYSVLEIVFEPGASATLLHAHYDFAETYVVLDGEVLAEVGTDRARAGPGTTITVPVGVTHLVRAAGRRPARCLCVTDRSRQSDLEYLP
jgi:mannose-6-phosphate isomerase-like protein (cupin superfamily)